MPILYDKSLETLHTFGLKATCRAYSPFKDVSTLLDLLRRAPRPHVILGGGSNILLPDHLEASVLHNQIGGILIEQESRSDLIVSAGAGVSWHQLVTWAVLQGLGGLENLALIPGTVGAAPMQNIGAYGVELADVFIQLEAMHRGTGEIRLFDKAECAFGYRDSVFKGPERDQWVIVRVWLKLSREPELKLDYGDLGTVLSEKGIDKPTIRDVYDAVIQIRQSKLPDPALLGNAGSFFKNPVIARAHYDRISSLLPGIPHYPVDEERVKVPAGWLIDKAGWKGVRRGGCGVHDRQALVLVHYGGSHASEIQALAQEILRDIKDKFGISLETEVNILGEDGSSVSITER